MNEELRMKWRVVRAVQDGVLTIWQYQYLHEWVYAKLGRPMECENCGSREESIYDWANISGEYKKDLSDWARLCRSCHRYFDAGAAKEFPADWTGKVCKRGHAMTDDNTYIYPKQQWKVCRVCRNIHASDQRYRRFLGKLSQSQLSSIGGMTE